MVLTPPSSYILYTIRELQFKIYIKHTKIILRKLFLYSLIVKINPL